MFIRCRSIAEFLRGQTRETCVGMIGGADGPTVLFLQAGRRPARSYDAGSLLLVPSPRALARAALTSLGLVLLVAALYRLLSR